jgi:hypothetical protein
MTTKPSPAQLAALVLLLGVLGSTKNVKSHLEAVADGVIATLLLVSRRRK